MNEESAFTFYSGVALDFFIHATNARTIAVDILQGKGPIGYEEFSKISHVKTLLLSSQARYELLKDNTDLPYGPAGDYIECMLELCSILMRIYLSKPVAVEDLSFMYDWIDDVSFTEYNKLFLPEIEPQYRFEVLTLQRKQDYWKDIILAEIFVGCEMGF